MKFIYQAILLLALCCSATMLGQAQQGEAPLTNTSVIKLVRAGFKEKTVIAIIRSRPNRFNLDPDHLIDLKRNGVTESIILAMLSQDEAFVSDDGWNDDAFFKGSGKPGQGDGGTDIFGSSSGSRNKSSSRGASGSNTGETQTMGSATVRILRPPSEAGGGAPPKLSELLRLITKRLFIWSRLVFLKARSSSESRTRRRSLIFHRRSLMSYAGDA